LTYTANNFQPAKF